MVAPFAVGGMAGPRETGDEADAMDLQRSVVPEVGDIADDAQSEIAFLFGLLGHCQAFLGIGHASGQEQAAQPKQPHVTQHGRFLPAREFREFDCGKLIRSLCGCVNVEFWN